jgi:hypothetical protein
MKRLLVLFHVIFGVEIHPVDPTLHSLKATEGITL